MCASVPGSVVDAASRQAGGRSHPKPAKVVLASAQKKHKRAAGGVEQLVQGAPQGRVHDLEQRAAVKDYNTIRGANDPEPETGEHTTRSGVQLCARCSFPTHTWQGVAHDESSQ